ncbi:helix-turn-helix domain-containing protein [Lachnospiraceae bacterium]|nr:helix-turn-helix domain-containing protein [Lachnospiraceae bacterium]
MTIQELRYKTNLSQKQFSEYFEIPIRTVQEWEQGRRKPPDYISKLLERIWNLETANQ